MATCSSDTCNLPAIHGKTECPLHCEKSTYNSDSQGIQLTRLFKDTLCIYLTQIMGAEFEDKTQKPRSVLERHLYSGHDDPNKRYSKFLKDKVINLLNIQFPDRRSHDPNDYLKILSKLKGIHFQDCTFSAGSIDLHETSIFFDGCSFVADYWVTDALMLENDSDALYSLCKFKSDVKISHNKDEEITSPLFSNCEFEKTLHLSSTAFPFKVFSDEISSRRKLAKIYISDATFKEKLILNGYNIQSLIIENSELHSKFEFKYNEVIKAQVNNTNFLGLVDTYKSKFRYFWVKKSIFDKIATFEECEFGIENPLDTDEVLTAKFNHVTFLDFTNFRDSKFYFGLDIRNTNLKEPPNFLGAKVKPEHTNRETFRIIKQSFDKIGNQIEANKYFSEEMKKYKEDISETGTKREKFILWVNEKSSDFGQDYLLPIKWIALSSLIYYLLAIAKEKNWLYQVLPCCGNFLSNVSTYLNGWAGHILPFQKFLEPGMELISLFFYVIFAGLIWQTVVAIKRHTRR
ncbi:hypothetical protein [Microbulbifer pacificus]|uniref:hypothetical protein n=1 Tax=Microbulbifer pacificus TaxID=407164 RepID=UPI00131A3D1D|nr:hypothetical protein [Microbulbifer pacificus]